MSEQPDSGPPRNMEGTDGGEESFKPMVTRREFLVGAGAGAAAAAAAAGAVTVIRSPAPQASTPAVAGISGQPGAAPGSPAATGPLPASFRRVTLNINGAAHELTVDVRESLWETITYQLGIGGVNVGCDRAQCGACAIQINGRAVNGCTVLSARLGRGQQIVTVEGIRTGPGVDGLHPIQRAYWQQGGFQCGICTRGFIMSAYTLLQGNTSPTRVQIREALAGNICRCSEYPKMYAAVEQAAAELRVAAALPPTAAIVLKGPGRIGGGVDTSGSLE